MVIPKHAMPPWPTNYDPQALFEDAAVFALQSLDPERALQMLADTSDLVGSAELRYASRIWHCEPFDDRLHIDAGPDRFQFSPHELGARWRIRSSNRYMLFTDIVIVGHRFTVGLEIAVRDQGERPVQTTSMYLLRSLDKVDRFVDGFPQVKFLRLVEIKGTGRCGFLLPKSLGWRVLPLPEISVGASPSMPASSDADRLVSLEDFISYNPSGSRFG